MYESVKGGNGGFGTKPAMNDEHCLIGFVMSFRKSIEQQFARTKRSRGSLIMASAIGLFGSMLVSAAEPVANPAPVGDAEAGKAKSAVCAGCHGADGNSVVSSFPKLAGQGIKYTVKQLQEIKSGVRPVPEMTAFAQALSDQDMLDIATYYSEQTSTVEGVDPELKELGQKLYRAGNAETGLPSCAACHGPAGDGMASAGFPKISGQHGAYTAAQLKAFRAAGRDDNEGKRRENDGETKMMRAVAAKLSDKEIDALADYISGLHQ